MEFKELTRIQLKDTLIGDLCIIKFELENESWLSAFDGGVTLLECIAQHCEDTNPNHISIQVRGHNEVIEEKLVSILKQFFQDSESRVNILVCYKDDPASGFRTLDPRRFIHSKSRLQGLVIENGTADMIYDLASLSIFRVISVCGFDYNTPFTKDACACNTSINLILESVNICHKTVQEMISIFPGKRNILSLTHIPNSEEDPSCNLLQFFSNPAFNILVLKRIPMKIFLLILSYVAHATHIKSLYLVSMVFTGINALTTLTLLQGFRHKELITFKNVYWNLPFYVNLYEFFVDTFKSVYINNVRHGSTTRVSLKGVKTLVCGFNEPAIDEMAKIFTCENMHRVKRLYILHPDTQTPESNTLIKTTLSKPFKTLAIDGWIGNLEQTMPILSAISETNELQQFSLDHYGVDACHLMPVIIKILQHNPQLSFLRLKLSNFDCMLISMLLKHVSQLSALVYLEVYYTEKCISALEGTLLESIQEVFSTCKFLSMIRLQGEKKFCLTNPRRTPYIEWLQGFGYNNPLCLLPEALRDMRKMLKKPQSISSSVFSSTNKRVRSF